MPRPVLMLSCSRQVELEDLQLVEGAFSDLANFEGSFFRAGGVVSFWERGRTWFDYTVTWTHMCCGSSGVQRSQVNSWFLLLASESERWRPQAERPVAWPS